MFYIKPLVALSLKLDASFFSYMAHDISETVDFTRDIFKLLGWVPGWDQ